jgi:hypothetical protein
LVTGTISDTAPAHAATPVVRGWRSLVENIEPEDPWILWARRPTGPRERLDDLVLQIRRDMAVLKEPRTYHPDDFFEQRIAAYQQEALSLMKELGLEH